MSAEPDTQRRQFVLLFGPPAVGKMTVAYALAEQTGFRVFHNHMTIDLVLPFFEFGSPAFGRLVGEFRRRIFEEVAASDLPGLVFTYVWALDDPEEKPWLDGICEIFRARGWDIAFVELEASVEERLRRNRTEFRLSRKPSKRNVERSEQNLRELDARYRLNTRDDFPYPERYLKLVTTELGPEEAARRIVEAFGFQQALDTPGAA